MDGPLCPGIPDVNGPRVGTYHRGAPMYNRYVGGHIFRVGDLILVIQFLFSCDTSLPVQIHMGAGDISRKSNKMLPLGGAAIKLGIAISACSSM